MLTTSNRPFSLKRTIKWFNKNIKMILNVNVDFKKLCELGRGYPWKKPKSCLCCESNRLWGHGYVPGYFDGYDDEIYLKRYRCPDCGCLIKLRPKNYFKRFQASIETIRASISSKEENNQWLSDISRTRQNYWYRALIRKIQAYLTNTWKKGILNAFDFLVKQGTIPVSRSI